MVQILQGPRNFGEIAGTGISDALNLLAQNKLQQVAKRNQQSETARGLEALQLGYSPEQLQSLSALSPDILQNIVKSKLAEPKEQAYASALSQLLSGGEPGQQVKLPGGLNEKQATELTKIALKKQEVSQKLSAKEQQEIQKATQPYYEETLAKAQVAKDAEKRLNRMDELIKRGKLPNSALYNVLNKLEENLASASAVGGAAGFLLGGPAGAGIGAGIGGALSPVASLLKSVVRGQSPDAEEFEKLSADFVKDAKAIFGGRITDQDLRTFMTMIPTLANTDAGKKVIIRNLKNLNKASEIRGKILREIIKENNNRRPIDIQEQVEERAAKELDQLASDFMAGK